MQTESTAREYFKQDARFLDSNEAARYLGLKKCTLDSWRCRGDGPRYLKIGRYVRYRLADLDSWLDSRTRTSTSEGGSE